MKNPYSDVQIPIDRTLTDQVVRVIRKGIILGKYEPGSRLVELQLAEKLQVSRSTIREAFRRLEGESLIEISPHRGTRVASIDASDALEICELHSLLESHIVRRIDLPVSSNVRDELIRHVDAMAKLSFPDQLDEFIDLDHGFHQTIVSTADRRQAQQLWSSMNARLGLLVAILSRYVPLDAAHTAQRHLAIVDAVSQRNRDVAATVISDHYRSLWERTEEALR